MIHTRMQTVYMRSMKEERTRNLETPFKKPIGKQSTLKERIRVNETNLCLPVFRGAH